MAKEYDIFISYRRSNGEDKARILNQFLSAIGYRVFFDHESGMTGEFETEILAAVEIAPVFLMLLTPNCLDRCVEEGDWVRREIERATKFNKTIIPIRPNYDDTIFKNLPSGIPDCVLHLSKLEFAELDFHKNFKVTAQTMVDEQIKKIVQPTMSIVETGTQGAKIHFFSDISCRVLHYGKSIAITDATDTTIGAVVHLLKGNHKLEYKSIEHESDGYSEVYTVPDNDYESFVNIELQPIKDKRKQKEEELKAAEERKALEEKKRREQHKIDSRYKYDIFFCYSRQDASIVRQAQYFLSQAGYRCWIDMDELAAGCEFANAITEAVEKSKSILFFSSEISNKSPWVQKELQYAISLKKKILVIQLDENASNSEWVNFVLGQNAWFTSDIRQRENLEKLLDFVKMGLGE